MKNKKIKKSITIIGIVLLVLIVGFVAWANNSYEPCKAAMASLDSGLGVEVTEDEYIVFKPENVTPEKGFIFYPGGKVEPESYSVLCRDIAEAGYLVVIAPMTLDLAVLSPNEADGIIERFSEIKHWAIGGHSLGGVMAADYASKNQNIEGLALYASYPQGDCIKDSDIDVVSIYGSLDGVADLDKVKNASLPEKSELIEIKGGNHCQFGDYGHQDGDNEAEISEEEQINEAAKYTIELLERL